MLTGTDGHILAVVCETQLKLMSKQGMITWILAFVVRGATNNLLGKHKIQDLDIIDVMNCVKDGYIVSKYPTLFEGLGTIEGGLHIKLNTEGQPYKFLVLKRIPIIGLREKFKEELSRMEKLVVISPIKDDTTWCGGVAVAHKKNG